MQTDTQLQQKTRDELLLIIEEKNKKIAQQQSHIFHLAEQIRLNRYKNFGKKSEKEAGDAVQLSLFDEAELPAIAEDANEEAEENITVPAHTRKKKRGRKALPAELDRVETVYDLTDDEKQCACGCELTCIGQESSERLEAVPAQVFVRVHTRKKYACNACEHTFKQAKMPKQLIPKSISSPSLLAHVAVAKFEDHLPLYRQEKIWQRAGVDISRSSLSQWIIRMGDAFQPLVNLLQSTIEGHDVAYSDETPVQVLHEENRRPEQKSYMWLFGGGPPDKFSFVYRYSPSRAHEVPLTFLGDFSGYLHCDGFVAYESLAAKKDITLVGCWYHARRKFMEAKKLSEKDGLAKKALAFIKKLSAIEKDIARGRLSSEQAYNARQRRAKPVLDAMHAWLMEKAPGVPKQHHIGKAIHYTLSQWPKLITYLKDGRLEISNNRTERGIKPFATGRKNWLFAGNVDGANAAAVIYSLIETCKAHEINTYEYLRFVIEKMPTATTLEEIEALLPFNCKEELSTISHS